MICTGTFGLVYFCQAILCAKVYSALIAYKIWLIERESAVGSVYKSRSLSPVLSSIIESGAIYSAALIALITTFASNSWGHYPVFDSVSPKLFLFAIYTYFITCE